MIIKEINLDKLNINEYLAFMEALADYYFVKFNKTIKIKIGECD